MQRDAKEFVALGDLVTSSKKVYIEGSSLFLARQFLRQQQTDKMKWLRDKVMLLWLTIIKILFK